jgi:2-polyprenyl-6-methoxyphenol hydroxylase-like FAD-dependent oxidoreductase
MTEQLHVIVAGGGIGGLCLAQGLRRAGVSVAVYERDASPTDRLEGYRIHINPAGSRALKACLPPPVWDSFVATAGEPGGLGFLTEQLSELAVINGEATADPAEGSHAVDRITLRHLPLSGLDDAVHFGKTFTHYEQHDGKVTAFFDDGSCATGDLLVGADGAGSVVRRQFLPHARRVPTEATATALRFPLTEQTRSWVPHRLATSMNMIIAPDPFFLFTSAFQRRSGSGDHDDLADRDIDTGRPYQSYILCAFVAHRSAYPRDVHDLDQRCLQQVVEAMTVGWHPDLRRLLADADSDSVMLVQHKTSVPVPGWPSTNVTVSGDAIHSMPPVGGLGGNAALRDAHLLCTTLTAVRDEQCALVPALHRYEAEMRTCGYGAVRTALRTQRQGLRSNHLAVAGTRAWFRACSTVPALKPLNLPYRAQARPRTWERT